MRNDNTLDAEGLAAKRYPRGYLDLVYERTGYAAAIREHSQPLADELATVKAELDELREALERLCRLPQHGIHGGPLTLVKGLYEDGTDETSARHCGSLDPLDFKHARAILEKYHKP